MRMRLIAALLVAAALGLGLSSVANAQFIVCTVPCPVYDASAVIRNTAINELKRQINALLNQENESLTAMSKRLSTVTNLAKYVIAPDDTPRWRTHGGDFLTYAVAYNDALLFGDPSGAGYASVSAPRVAPDAILARLAPDAAAYLRRELATLDLADSTMIRGTHEDGTLRYNGRKEEFLAVEALSQDVTNPSTLQSATAVLDKISGAKLIAGRQVQTRIQLVTAALEQLLVDSKRDRDRDVIEMNMTLNALRAMSDLDDGGTPASVSLVAHADDALRRWRQP
jgi:hypothetical protein